MKRRPRIENLIDRGSAPSAVETTIFLNRLDAGVQFGVAAKRVEEPLGVAEEFRD